MAESIFETVYWQSKILGRVCTSLAVGTVHLPGLIGTTVL